LEVILEVIGSADRLPDIDRANMEYYATFQFIFVSKKYKNNKGNDASTGKVCVPPPDGPRPRRSLQIPLQKKLRFTFRFLFLQAQYFGKRIRRVGRVQHGAGVRTSDCLQSALPFSVSLLAAGGAEGGRRGGRGKEEGWRGVVSSMQYGVLGLRGIWKRRGACIFHALHM